jgi:hypothetical protein
MRSIEIVKPEMVYIIYTFQFLICRREPATTDTEMPASYICPLKHDCYKVLFKNKEELQPIQTAPLPAHPDKDGDSLPHN